MSAVVTHMPDCYCSFCGRSAGEAALLVAGPAVFICDACIDKSAIILANHRAESPEPPITVTKPAPRRSQVYFIYSVATKAIKIGIGRTAERRLSNLQMGSAEKLVLLGWFWGTEEDEKSAHLMFHDIRLSGEWFRDCERLRAFIAEKVTPL